ncbi:MAG TPA: GGDEF domain-containing protein, partial [Burkholderiales bacterium]|nr:GGDEF domain-containing protein [Burkholderiales bacterium]
MSSKDRKPAAGRAYVDGQAPCIVEQPVFSTGAQSIVSTTDSSEIVASVGLVTYEWDIESDDIVWGANAAAVLQIPDLASISTGRGFAQLVDTQGGQSRFDAVMRSPKRDEGIGIAYEIEYALRLNPNSQVCIWLEDTGRWFASSEGRPIRAHGVVRVINERHEHEAKLSYLSRFDALTGEMNRWHMTEVLESVLEEAVKLRSSCGFLLAGIDNLARINEAYGFDIADEVIAAVAKRIRSRLRGKDHLGRYSGNKFGIVLQNCTPEDMLIAADRLLTGARDEVVRTEVGPVAITMTVGGVTAPRHARNVREILTRAQDALDAAKSKRRGSFQAYQPNLEREVRRQENVRATDEIVTALNERRIFLVYEPVVDIGSRKPA